METIFKIPKELKTALNFHTISFVSKNWGIILFKIVNVDINTKRGVIASLGLYQIFVINLGLFIIFISSLLTKELVRYSCLKYASILYFYACVEGVTLVSLYTPGDHNIFNYFITVSIILGVIVEMIFASIYKDVLVPFSVEKFTRLSSNTEVIEAFIIRQEILSLCLVNLVTLVVFITKYIVFPILSNPNSRKFAFESGRDVVYSRYSFLVYLIIILWSIILLLATINFDKEIALQRIVTLALLGINMMFHIIICVIYSINISGAALEA